MLYFIHSTDTANEVQLATVSAKQSAEEYVNLFRKQVRLARLAALYHVSSLGLHPPMLT